MVPSIYFVSVLNRVGRNKNGKFSNFINDIENNWIAYFKKFLNIKFKTNQLLAQQNFNYNAIRNI